MTLLLGGAPSSVMDKEEIILQRDVKIRKGSPSAMNVDQRGDHSMLMDPQPKRPFAKWVRGTNAVMWAS